MEVAFDGISVDIVEVLEESKKAAAHDAPMYGWESHDFLYRIVLDLLGCLAYLGDCTTVLYANGLTGNPKSH